MGDTIDLHSGTNNNTISSSQQHFSTTSSIGSKSSRRFRYKGRMVSVKAMNQLPPVDEKDQTTEALLDLKKNRRVLWYSVLAILSYFFMGSLVYTLWLPDWNFVDAMYFTIATLSTVGYGDIVVMNDGQRAFTIFYIIGGTFLVGGIFYGFLFDHLYNAFQSIQKEAKLVTCDYFIERLDNGGPEGFVLEEEELFWPDMLKNFAKAAPLLVALIVPPLIMGYYEDWNVLESFYFTVVTANTVGYGDVAPQNTYMRLISVFYLPLCLGVMAKTFSKLTTVFLRHKAKAAEQEFFNRKLSDNDFELMDIEGDGSVGYDEFLVFMLVAMGKVTPEDIQKMEELYQRLDAETENALKVEDLFTMAYGEAKEV